MSLSIEFCEQRAREAAAAAKEASLANVRERELRSESAWREMADRIQSIKDGREAIRQQRAETEG